MRLIDADALMQKLTKSVDRNNDPHMFVEDAFHFLSNAPTVNPWHRVEEPPQSGQKCFMAYRSILRSDPEWLYDICYYTDDLARDCPLMRDAEHRPGWYRYESEYGDVERHPKYWMPIDPPKE